MMRQVLDAISLWAMPVLLVAGENDERAAAGASEGAGRASGGIVGAGLAERENE